MPDLDLNAHNPLKHPYEIKILCLNHLLKNEKLSIRTFNEKEFELYTSAITTKLISRFLRMYEPGHNIDNVAQYDILCTGTIITSLEKDDTKVVVLGESETLVLFTLLLYLHRHESLEDISKAITYDKSKQELSVTIEHPKYKSCLSALYSHSKTFPPFQKNYQIIREKFHSSMDKTAEQCFIDWLKWKVYMEHIDCTSMKDAIWLHNLYVCNPEDW